ncbi:hypothetical protein OC861_003659 [Tilletia horrida]|nr:hypothetical protein OC861_003659 [Tilletia horrida]
MEDRILGSRRNRQSARQSTYARHRPTRRLPLIAWVPLLFCLAVVILRPASSLSARYAEEHDFLLDPDDDQQITAAISNRTRPPHLARSFTARDYSALAPTSPVIRLIPNLTDPAPSIDFRQSSSFLSKILIPRVPDTHNNTLVQQIIADIFEHELKPKPSSPHGPARSGWTLERQTFESNTPEGKRKFTNLIATKERDAPRKLMLAAHFDSKFFAKGTREEGFIGATDSAAPCAILVDVVRAVDSLLDRRTEARKKKGESIAAETTLQLVFFDGEEAFHAWTHSDSIYGARALASNWTEPILPLLPPTRRSADDGEESVDLEPRRLTPPAYTPVKPVDTIEHMVLLDLLGAPDPAIPNYFGHTSWLYDHLVDAERKLRSADILIWPTEADKKKSFFTNRQAWGGIEDDHLPFAEAGVPIFHLIPSPFPPVWHRITDDASALDYPTMYAWAMLMRLFTIEYLDLSPFVG